MLARVFFGMRVESDYFKEKTKELKNLNCLLLDSCDKSEYTFLD